MIRKLRIKGKREAIIGALPHVFCGFASNFEILTNIHAISPDFQKIILEFSRYPPQGSYEFNRKLNLS
jgi:hypothetical protein